MTETQQVIARIRAHAAAKNWSKTKLAKEAGLHFNTLRDFDDEDWNPRLGTLQKLEALLPENTDTEDVQAAS